MSKYLRDNVVRLRKLSDMDSSSTVYYQDHERQNFAGKRVLSSESFSSTELSVSRNSSFSSCSSSATGSSGYGCASIDTDSSPSRSSVISSGLDSALRHDTMTNPDDLPCARRRKTARSKHKPERNSLPPDQRQLEKSLSNPNHPHLKTKAAEDERISSGFTERSISETELFLPRSHLSSPEGLIISTPPARGTQLSACDKRVRSKSASYDEKNAPKIESGSKEKTKDSRKPKRNEQTKRRETTAFDLCIDETAMKRCLVVLEQGCGGRKGQKLKEASKRIAALESQVEQVCQERDCALRERNEVMHDRDRIKCERDALELERDNLLRNKERLEKELINRSNVIDHLKEHLGLAVIPVKLTSRTCPVTVQVPKQTTTTYELDAPAGRKYKTRPRSKSEIKTPEFYFPDQILKTNAYTCL